MKVVYKKEPYLTYKKRKAIYAIIENGEKEIALIHSNNIYFLLGGGIELGEDEFTALNREILEETGYTIKNRKYFDKVKSYEYNKKYGFLEIEATIFTAEFDKKVCAKKELDHDLVIINPITTKINLYHKYQNYILNEYVRKKFKNKKESYNRLPKIP